MYAILKVKFVEYIQITIVDSMFNNCYYYLKTTRTQLVLLIVYFDLTVVLSTPKQKISILLVQQN